MIDNQEVLHCANCGTSFFEDNGINRIGIDRARTLAKERYNKGSVIGQKPVCPRDESPLTLLSNTESVPRTVKLFQCPQCHGILASADDLELFKRAQLSKLDYFKSWNMPLGSLKGVLAIALLLVISGSILWTYSTVSQEATIRSEASELIKTIEVSGAADYTLISFRTKEAVKSTLVIDNLSTHQQTFVPISEVPKTTHTVSFARPSSEYLVTYRVRLEDKNGRTVNSQEVKISP